MKQFPTIETESSLILELPLAELLNMMLFYFGNRACAAIASSPLCAGLYTVFVLVSCRSYLDDILPPSPTFTPDVTFLNNINQSLDEHL